MVSLRLIWGITLPLFFHLTVLFSSTELSEDRSIEHAVRSVQHSVQQSSNPEALVSVLVQFMQQRTYDEERFLQQLEKNTNGTFHKKALFEEFLSKLPNELKDHQRLFHRLKESLLSPTPSDIPLTIFHDKTIAITGGGGYIGKIVTCALLDAGVKKVILYDCAPRNLDIFKEAIENKKVEIFQGAEADITREENLKHALYNNGRPCDGVLHLAAYIAAGSSTKRPAQYFYNNVIGTQSVLKVMQELGIDVFSFASSAGVFSGVETNRNGFLGNEQLVNPQNPYGETKGLMEQLMHHVPRMNYCALRFFNVAGAIIWHGAYVGEDHWGVETHVVPRAIQAYLTKNIPFQIYGNDYATPDGTAIRDYIHIQDLSNAIVRSLALQFHMKSTGKQCKKIVTLGSGAGTSVREITNSIEKKIESETGETFHFATGPRRIGDPPALMASGYDAFMLLDWLPQNGIQEILDDAWRLHVDQYQHHRIQFDDSNSPEFQDQRSEETYVQMIHTKLIEDASLSLEVQFETLFRLLIDLLRKPSLEYRHASLSVDQRDTIEAIVHMASSFFTLHQPIIHSVSESDQLRFCMQMLFESLDDSPMNETLKDVWHSLSDVLTRYAKTISCERQNSLPTRRQKAQEEQQERRSRYGF